MFTLGKGDTCLKKEASALTLLFLMSISLSAPSFFVKGQVGVNIYLATPSQGVAGQLVNLQGTIDTTNGTYEIYLGSRLVTTDKSEGFYVNANFSVPELPAADYLITLKDVTEGANATQAFAVLEGYNVTATTPSPPLQLQEGSSISLNVTLTGGQVGTTYSANITVEMPSPLKTEYSRIIALTPVNQTGTALAVVAFPSTDFQPSGSLTNFTGLYSVYFNKTAQLASSQFFIGFTDANLYHRGDSVTIRAIGYESNQSASIKITNQETGADVFSSSFTATNEGVINSLWTIPNDALIGTYEANITPVGTGKSIVDSQNFTIPGYPTRIRAVSLAGAPVPNMLIEALDQASNKVYSGTTGDDGAATINLEKGSANITAYWNDVKVGTLLLTITGESAHDVPCSLINLRITVKDKSGFLIPFVSLNITYGYVTTKQGLSRLGSALGQTDISGTFILDSVLPGINYTINASLYRVVFNAGNNTYTNIPAVPTYEIVVFLPSRSLTLTVLDYNLKGLADARVALSEQTSGIFYANSTNDAGIASMEVGFGSYQVSIYKGNILLNETVIEVFTNTETEVRCVLYNLRLSVSVVDFFGHPVPNVDVHFRGPDQVTWSNTTLSDGTTIFSDVIGGDVQLIAYPANIENYYEALNLKLDSPTAVQIKLGKFVILGSLLIDVGLFITIMIILPIVIVLIILEFFRRRKLKASERKPKAISASK